MWKATHIFFRKKLQHICLSLDVNFNESLTNDIISFEQLGPDDVSEICKLNGKECTSIHCTQPPTDLDSFTHICIQIFSLQ